MGYKKYQDFDEMDINELHQEREDIAFALIEAGKEEAEQLEEYLEEIENIITNKEAGIEELKF